MHDSNFSIQDDFPPVHYEQWRALVDESLQGAVFEKKLVTSTYEGIDQQPVYSLQDQLGTTDAPGLPGYSPFVRGTTPSGACLQGWDLRQEHSAPEPGAANRAILQDLQGGVRSLLLVFDEASRRGLNPDDPKAIDFVGRKGVMVYHLEDLDTALAHVDFSKTGITLDAGAAFLPASALLAASWQRRQLSPDTIRGAFNADPIAELARQGSLPLTMENALSQMVHLADWTSKNYPQVTAISVDTSPFHHAGATAAQDLAFALATAIEYLRAMTGAEMDIDVAAKQLLFRLSLGTHHFLSIAKLRAGRLLWSRVIEACGGSAASAAMHTHCRLSNRVLTKNDPFVNILRNTVGVFSAGIGGAEAITSIPFDYAIGQSEDFGRRVARNTGLVLQQEAHLHRVIDPAGGSWFIEKLTRQLAEKSWEIFQEIERHGGMIKSLESGWVAKQIGEAYAPRTKDIATRKEGIIGVSEFPNINEDKIAYSPPDLQTLREAAIGRVNTVRKEPYSLTTLPSAESKVAAAVQSAFDGATIGQLAEALGFHGASTNITPLEPHSFAEPYEELREACNCWQQIHGRRPTVFLANLGPVAHHTARATYAKGFFEAGGFAVITNEGFPDADSVAKAFADSGTRIAVLCSSDKLYQEFVPQVATRLKATDARTVLLAGKPGTNEAAWRAAGVDRFIYITCNVLATLRELLEEEGVLIA
jgi:methylmalonyl-CoA mutase